MCKKKVRNWKLFQSDSNAKLIHKRPLGARVRLKICSNVWEIFIIYVSGLCYIHIFVYFTHHTCVPSIFVGFIHICFFFFLIFALSKWRYLSYNSAYCFLFKYQLTDFESKLGIFMKLKVILHLKWINYRISKYLKMVTIKMIKIR